MLLSQSPEYKYQTQVLKLPFQPKGTLVNTYIGLIIKDTNQAIDILNNPKIKRDIKFSRYYKPYLFRDRVFTYNARYKMAPSEMADLTSFAKTLNLTFYNRPLAVKNKNILVDTSLLNTVYFDHTKGRAYKLIAQQYIVHLQRYLSTFCKFPHTNRYLMINISDWGISGDNKAQQLSAANRFLNPISIIYFLLKKKMMEDLEPLKEYKLIVLDGKNGWFWLDLGTLDKESFMKFHKVFMKVKNQDIIIPEISEDQTLEDIESRKEKVIDTAPLQDTKPHFAPKEEDEDFPEEIDIDEKPEEKDEISNEDLIKEEEERLIKAVEEIENNHEDNNRSMAMNKRDAELRKKQKEIKVNKIKLGELEKREPKNYHIDEVSLQDKIFGPTKNSKMIRFDNFNESYNKNLMDRDILNVFNSLQDRRLPIYVRKISVEDTSDAMNLKKTYKVEMEDKDRVRHTMTIDVPIPYDKNYFVIGGNRKQLNNQQFPKPVIKLGPDTVQICSNYMKIFMYRYGDIISPKVTIFKKIIANNPKYFKVKRGNACALNKGKKSSIELDSLAKDYISIEIRNTGVSLQLVQSFFDDKKLHPINDDFVYVIWDENAKNHDISAIPISVEHDNDGLNLDEEFDVEEYKKNPSAGGVDSVIDLFAHFFKQKMNMNFWDLAGPKDKAGKRFMFTRCKISQKFVPTIVLTSYYEGLSTVLRKAGIQYRFSDKSERLEAHKDEGKIQFKNGFLIYNRSLAKHALLMNGLSLIDTRNYDFEEFDKRDVYLDIFDTLYGNRVLGRLLISFYDNMIDPITKEVLEDLDYPTDFVQLLIFANDLLADNEFSSELDMSKYRIRCMEQVPALLYKIVADAYSAYEATADNKTPTKMSVPRNELLKRITMANNVEDYSTINPITEKEKLHNISSKGPTGVNLERAYTMEKRCFDSSMTGMIGISTSPDANCGVQRELTIEPKIMNARGYIDVSKSTDEMKDMNLFTYAEQLSPGGIVRDDAIRSSMMTKQSWISLVA